MQRVFHARRSCEALADGHVESYQTHVAHEFAGVHLCLCNPDVSACRLSSLNPPLRTACSPAHIYALLPYLKTAGVDDVLGLPFVSQAHPHVCRYRPFQSLHVQGLPTFGGHAHAHPICVSFDNLVQRHLRP